MRKRRKLVGLTVLTVVALGATFTWISVTNQTNDVAVLEGRLGRYELITRKQVLAKPRIDLKLPGGSKFTWPKPFDRADQYKSYFDDGSDASALFVPRPQRFMSSFSDATFDINGTHIQVRGMIQQIPFVFGDKPAIIGYRPAPDADWLKLRILPNGKPVPKNPPFEVKLDRYTVRFQALEPFFTILPTRVEVTVIGGEPGDEFAVFTSHMGTSGPVRCDSKPGILMVAHPNPGLCYVTLEVLKREAETLNVSVKPSGSMRSFTVNDHHGHSIMVGEIDSNSTMTQGNWACWKAEKGARGYFETVDDTLNSLPRISQSGFFTSRALQDLKAGPMAVHFYRIVKSFTGEARLDLPVPSSN